MRLTFLPLLLCGLVIPLHAVQAEVKTHPPMRPLPKPANLPISKGPTVFVDATLGNDKNPGTQALPWKTLNHSLRQLKPGYTLYLRGGVFHEKSFLTVSGTLEDPITISSYPGELAILDGSLKEFLSSPSSSWVPFDKGAPGEFVSSKSYLDLYTRQAPTQFLPGSWEPMWGIEDDRPLALGFFADPMVPLHGYRTVTDLRSQNELWLGKAEKSGFYCGPGVWFNRETGRLHIRLAHHRLEGLGANAYQGETDPRKIPLLISIGFAPEVLRCTGIKNVRLQDLVIRGATGSPLVQVYGCENLTFNHVTFFGGFPALLINACKGLQITNSAFRGNAAPWSSRAHMKYKGTASYQIILQNSQPMNDNITFAFCEFTDDHDFAYLRFVTNLQFHHNFVDNFNDDGLEVGAKLRNHTIFIHQNRIGRALIPLTQHEIRKDDSPKDHDEGSGIYFFRNVVDLRGGVYSSPPGENAKEKTSLFQEGHLASDHGSPIWPVMKLYHNSFLRDTPVFRDYFLFGLGAQGLRNNERDVFNNLFIQSNRLPGVNFTGMQQAEKLREGGNLLWSPKEVPPLPFDKFRASALFRDSKNHYEPGWTTKDIVADPKFIRFESEKGKPADLGLKKESPAVDTGLTLPTNWPDPWRSKDNGNPDIGVLPFGVLQWGVGVNSRIPLFGN